MRAIVRIVFAISTFFVWTIGCGAAQRTTRRLEDVPSLKLHFTMKRSSMAVNGQTEFNVFANPVVSADGSFLYNAITTIEDGVTTYKYMLVDGIAYYVEESDLLLTQKTQCLPAAFIPPVNDLLSAINNASPASGVESADETIECFSGSLYLVSFAGQDYALCAESSGFTVYGSNFNIVASYQNEVTTITAPTMSASISCEVVATSTPVSANTLAILTGTIAANATASTRTLEDAATISLAASSCSCKSTKRPCIFFEGFGSTAETGLSSTSDYFGDISAPCCSSIQYAVLNTNDYGWNDTTLQQKVCDYTLSVSSTSTGRTIKDTIIIAHSMGNLMLAGALANGKCLIDASSTSWVALSGPMKGSMGSDYLQSSCTDGGLLAAVANLIEGCPASPALLSLAYETGTYATSTLVAQYAAAQAMYQKYVTGAICSNGYTGLLSSDQFVYWLAGSIIPHKSSQNDGVVEYLSCAGGLSTTKFDSTYTSPFYVTTLNHADTAFRHGDSSTSTAQMPVKWFECLL